MLAVSDLHAGYGTLEVIHALGFEVGSGEVVVILGANGAGKTTTLRALSGLLPRRGQVQFDDHDISRASADEILRLGVAQVPQGRGTFDDLTVDENLAVGAYTRRDDEVGDDRTYWFDAFPRLAERRGQKAGSLSGGEQQMLAIARALMSRPQLLLCDEPSLGLAPIITQELFRRLAELSRDTGIAVLLVEQNANLALEIASRAYVLETGRIVASGTAEALRNDDTIRQAYLGI
jgi:branched-chain amino acid transport system ATP-binding protein